MARGHLAIAIAAALYVSVSGMANADPVFGYDTELDIVYGTGRVAPDGNVTERELRLDVYSPSASNADYTGAGSLSDGPYLLWLREAKGLSEASVDKAASAISTYEDFLGSHDFRAFHSEKARAFKRKLASQVSAQTGAKLSQGSINGVLREVKSFFKWLADQPSYKSRISHSDADYLSPDRKSETARRGTCWKPHPSAAHVQLVLQSMPTDTVARRRDRALVAFLFLTGSREGAAISLRLGHVDTATKCVSFEGRSVNT